VKVKDLMAELSAIDGDFDVLVYGVFLIGGFGCEGEWNPLQAVDVDETGRKVHIG
jgi:hypothetical protein